MPGDFKSQLAYARHILDNMEALYSKTQDPALKQVLVTGLNKACGQFASAVREVDQNILNAGKGRDIVTQTYGDLTVGKAEEAFAKTIELKSKTDANPTNVDKEIKKGLRQIQGLTGSQPRQGDHWVLDVAISNDCNRWPYGGVNKARDPVQFQDLAKTAAQRLALQIKNEEHKNLLEYIGAHDVANPSLHLMPLGQMIAKYPHAKEIYGDHPKSSRPFAFQGSGGMLSWPQKLNALTIKIRYLGGFPYPLAAAHMNFNFVAEMKFWVVGNSQTDGYEVRLVSWKGV